MTRSVAISPRVTQRRAVTTPSGIAPGGFEHAPTQPASEEHLDLVIGPVGIVELVYQAGRVDVHVQAGLLEDLADQIVGKGRMGLHAAAGRAPQVRPSRGPGRR